MRSQNSLAQRNSDQIWLKTNITELPRGTIRTHESWLEVSFRMLESAEDSRYIEARGNKWESLYILTSEKFHSCYY
jgi:hypothetical protein